MTVVVRERQGVQVVTLSGEIDLETSGEVRDAVLHCLRERCPVVVDMAGIGYIDSSGVASLVEGFQVARQQGTPFFLASVSPAAMRVLKLARLDAIFAIVADVDTAVAQGA
jgi:anti-sigma B factor antagonist